MSLKTLDNALEIMKCFTKECPSWGGRELAKKLGKSHTIVFRILSTFEKHGYPVQNQDTKKYELGLKFVEYSLLVQEKLQIGELIHPIMSQLVKETEESVFLTWLDKLEGIYLSIAESNRTVKFAVSVGTKLPLYISAPGQTIMAYLPESAQQEIIDNGLVSRTAHTITDPKTLMKCLEKVRGQGWLYSTGEYADEVAGISMPIFDHNNKIVASLTTAAPNYRFPEDVAVNLLNKLEQACNEIQGKIRTYRLS